MSGNKNQSANPVLIKGIIFLILFICGLFGYLVLKETYQKKEVEKEITALKQEAEKIQNENIKIEDRIAYLASADYQKIEAKDKLNLQDPGEKVVIVSQNPIEKKEIPAEPENNSNGKKLSYIPNYEKWWNYFFKQ
jgi:cell division protein FtsB